MVYISKKAYNGSSEEVDVTIHVKSDAENNNPSPKDIEVKKGQTPDPKDGIENAGDLPEGTEFEFVAEPDTSTPGEKTVKIKITYPDGSSEIVETTIKIAKEKEAVKPEAQESHVEKGEKPDPADAIKNQDELPPGTKFEFKDEPDTSTPGKKNVTIIVTYPDGSTEEINSTIVVEAGEPTGKVDKEKLQTAYNLGKYAEGLANYPKVPEKLRKEFEKLMASAQLLLSDPSAIQADVDAMTAKLEAMIKQLKAAADLKIPTSPTGTTGDIGKTTSPVISPVKTIKAVTAKPINKLPKTGDLANAAPYAGLAGLAIIALVAILRKKRGENK